MKNTDAMTKTVKERAKNKEKHTLKVIDQMKKRGDKISIYSVSKEAGVSRNYLYNNSLLFDIINRERTIEPVVREETSTQTVINALKMKIAKLERENIELRKNNFMEKYEKLRQENAELKKQLETAYKY